MKQSNSLPTLFTPFQVAISTYVFGFFSGSIMTFLDFKKLGKKSWFLLLIFFPIFAVVFQFFLILAFGNEYDFVNNFLKIFFAIIFFWYQRTLIKENLVFYIKEGFVKSILIGIVGLFIENYIYQFIIYSI